MKKNLPFLLLLLIISTGCEEQATDLQAGEEWAHILGTVKYAQNLQPVNGAFIRTQTHMETTTSNATGQYDLAIALPKDEQENVTVEVYKEGYLTVNIPAIIAAGETTLLPVVTIQIYLDSTIVDTSYTGSGPGEIIVIISIDPDTLSVSGAGGQSVSQIICEVRDASGNPVDSLHTSQILFSLVENPGSGCYLYPETDVTDHFGRVQTAFYAGTDAGIAIVQAQFATSSTFIILPEIVVFETGPPASIELIYLEYDSVAVAGTGANEATTATFVVKDAGGSQITLQQPTAVHFEILGNTGGGEYLFPETDTTDALGQVSTTLNSGTNPGTIQIRAYASIGSGTIACTPVPIAIHSGLPHPDHFGAFPRYINFPGYNYFGRSDSILAIVGDQYANPVPMGTSVYFQTDYGIIQGSATTDSVGFAAVLLFSGPPMPPPYNPFGHIIAQTVAQGGAIITDTCSVLFTGITQIDSVAPNEFDIPDGEEQVFNYWISDVNGWPLSYGSKIEVSATVGAVLGQVDVTYPDTQDPSWTQFNFILYDNNPQDPDPAARAAISIIVTSPNGDASYIIEGWID